MAADPVRIVYVEDDSDNVYVLTRRLARRGYDVAVASDGAAGIETVRKLKPALVLMDEPAGAGRLGSDAELKADPMTRGIPVIGLSSHAMIGDREAALAAGCDDYETKPIEIERLLAKMQELLARGAP